jgi:hypothetical protein
MGDVGLDGCTWFLLSPEPDVGSDLLHQVVPECVAESGQFLLAEPVTFGFQMAISKRAKPHGQS